MPNTFIQPIILLIMATVTLLLAPQRSLAFGSIIGRVINCNSSSKLLSSYSIRSLSTIRGGNQRYSSTSVQTTVTNNDLSNFSLPSSFDDNRRDDVTSALLSVYSACRVTHHVQSTSSKHIGTISKQDSSPVTVGDFSAQAILCIGLQCWLSYHHSRSISTRKYLKIHMNFASLLGLRLLEKIVCKSSILNPPVKAWV